MTQEIIPTGGKPAAGWYPGDIPGTERWWDGNAWTEHTRPIQAVSAPRQTQPMLNHQHQQGYQVQPQHASGHLAATDQQTNSVEVALAWIFTVLTFGYLLPWAIAASRGKSNSVAIGLLNLFLGWTAVGWIVALIMACGAHQQRMNVVQIVNAPTYYNPPSQF